MYEACKAAMRASQNFQWTDTYPNFNIVEQDIKSGHLYVLSDGKSVLGSIVVNTDQDPQYDKIKWEETIGPFLIIHRLAVHPAHQKKGLAKKLMEFAENFALINQYKSIRLDAYTANVAASRLYIERMYKERGQLYFRNLAIPFCCYEKQVI